MRVLVLDEDARPIELREITATSLEPTRPLRLTRKPRIRRARSLSPTLWARIYASPPKRRVTRDWAREAAAPRAQLTLRRGVIVEGRITSVRGRRVVSGASPVFPKTRAQSGHQRR